MSGFFQVLLTVALMVWACLLSASEMVIFPENEYSVNGYSTVQGVFGVHCNGWQRNMGKKEIRELNLNAARQPVWPWSQYDKDQKNYLLFTPWAVRHYSKKPGEYYKTRAEAFAAWKNWADQDFYTEFTPAMDKFMQNRRIDMSHQLTLNKEYGITDNISVFMQHYHIDGRVELNIDKIKDYFDIYISGLKKHHLDIKIQYLQWYNEPNYSDFAGMYDSTREAVDAYIRIFNTLSEFVASKHPDVKMVGTCIASGTYFNWNGWADWVVPFIEKGWNIDMYNYHNYDNGCLNSLNRISMLQSKAEAIRGKRPRAMITECNYRLFDKSNAADKPRLLWTAEDILTMANHPDKFFMRCQHMLSSFPGNKPGTSSLVWVNKERTKFRLNDLYWAYWIMADVRGKLVAYDCDDPELVTFVCSPAKNKLVMCVVNTTEFSRTLSIDSGLGSQKIKNVKSRYGYYSGEKFVHGAKVLPDKSIMALDIKPYSLQSIVWEIDNPDFICRGKIREKEFYAKVTAQKISKNMPVAINVSELPAADDLVFLRMGVFSDELIDARSLAFTFNGLKYDVLWENTRKQVQDTAVDNWFVELPVPRSAVSDSNRIVFSDTDAPYKLMYASLVYKGMPSQEQAVILEKRNLAKEKTRIQSSLKTYPAYVSGRKDHIYLDVRNGSDKKIKYTVAIDSPKILGLIDKPAIEFELQAGSSRQLDMTVEPLDVKTQQTVKLQIKVNAGGQSRLITRKVSIFPPRSAYYFDHPPVIDAALTDWRHIPPVTFRRDGITTAARLGWDKNNFYSIIQVSGRKPMPINAVDNFWNQDCVEYFFDMGNEKTYLYDGNDRHYFAAPVVAATGKPCIGIVNVRKKGDLWENDSIVEASGCRIASRITDHGYIVECAIPWRQLASGFTPRPGAMLGFDLAITPQNYSIFGLDMKYHNKPDKWGILTLKNKADSYNDQPVNIDSGSFHKKKILLDFNFAESFDRSKLLTRQSVKVHGKCLEMSARPKKYQGSCLKVKEAVTSALDDSGVMTRIVLEGVEKGKADRSEDSWIQLLRCVWAPDIPGGHDFVDPYTMGGPLFFLQVAFDEKSDHVKFSLYKKNVSGKRKNGFGILLWAGTAKKKFPMEIDFWLSGNAYSINVFGDQTAKGVKSARHGMAPFFDGKPLKFAIRNVNGSHWQGKTKLKQLSFTKGK